MSEAKQGDMSESQGPSSTDLMSAIVALHDFTERGLGSFSSKIDRLDAKLECRIDRLQYDINRRFDRVDDRFDRVDERFDCLETRVKHLERNSAR